MIQFSFLQLNTKSDIFLKMSSKKPAKTMTIFFDGAIWKLHKEQSDLLISFASILKGIPELMEFIQGFLCNDYNAIFRSYLATFLFVWVSASLHPAFSFILLSFFVYIAATFLRQKVQICDISPSDPALQTALNIYFTYRRIYVYMSWGKAALVFLLVMLIFLCCKPPILATIAPALISSLLIKTEQSVSRMRVNFI